MNRFFVIASLAFALTLAQGCASIKTSSKTSQSLSSFLGFSELPDWYLTSRYAYPDSFRQYNDFGLDLHYRDTGEGPVVLLLHGEMGSLHNWEPWIERMRSDFRVIALDLPGSGLTGPTHCIDDIVDTCPENLNLTYLEHTLKYFIEDMQVRQLSIVGSGLGAYLGARYTIANPQKVERLVLATPVGLQQELPESLATLTTLGPVMRYVQPAPVMTELYQDFYSEPENNQGAVKRAMDLGQADGAHRSNIIQLEMVAEFMRHGSADEFASIQVPTLILWGQQDKWGDSALAERWEAQFPDSELVLYPALGNRLMEEATEITSADVIAFLQDEPLPSIEGLGTGETFSLDDAASQFDKASLFGPQDDAPGEPDDGGETVEMEDEF